jgi:hypothetical protein
MHRTASLILLAVVGCGLSAARAAAPPSARAVLGVPASAVEKTAVSVDALIFNPTGKPVTTKCRLDADGLAVDGKDAERRAWLDAGAYLPLSWQAKAGKPGAAKLVLLLDGERSAEAHLKVVPARKKPIIEKAHRLSVGPLVFSVPEAAGPCEIEVEITAGAAGELRATLERLAARGGVGPGALVARGVVPAALGARPEAPAELAALYRLQAGSGGWGARALGLPDTRTTSWVVFWLGRLKAAGVDVDKNVVKAGIGFLRGRVARAAPEMRARILPALAADGKLGPEDTAALTKTGLDKLRPMARLLAAYGSPQVELPPRAKWQDLGARQTAVLAAVCAGRKQTADARGLLPRLFDRRGADAGRNTHEGPLCALALHALAKLEKGPYEAAAQVRLGGQVLATLSTTRAAPVARRTAAVPAGGGGVEIRQTGEPAIEVFCRVSVRPADRSPASREPAE